MESPRSSDPMRATKPRRRSLRKFSNCAVSSFCSSRSRGGNPRVEHQHVFFPLPFGRGEDAELFPFDRGNGIADRHRTAFTIFGRVEFVDCNAGPRRPLADMRFRQRANFSFSPMSELE